MNIVFVSIPIIHVDESSDPAVHNVFPSLQYDTHWQLLTCELFNDDISVCDVVVVFIAVISLCDDEFLTLLLFDDMHEPSKRKERDELILKWWGVTCVMCDIFFIKKNCLLLALLLCTTYFCMCLYNQS